MNEEEKKDNSASWINYRTDHAEQQIEREKKAANEDANKAKGQIKAGIGDATGGDVKNPKQHIKEGKEREGKSFAEKYLESKKPQTRLLEAKEKKQITVDKKDLHLKSTTALTDPETAKQNLKDASKAKNFGKETPPSRGGFRGGGSPMMREPDEVIKEKHKTTNPEDILSKKSEEKSFLLAMNEEKKPVIVNRTQEQKLQQPQGKHSPTTSQKEAQKQVEQKQVVKTKSFKPTPPKNILDTLPKHLLSPKEGETKAQKERLEKPQQMKASERVKKAVVEKNAKPLPTVVKNPEKISPSPTKAEMRSKPVGTGKIKR